MKTTLSADDVGVPLMKVGHRPSALLLFIANTHDNNPPKKTTLPRDPFLTTVIGLCCIIWDKIFTTFGKYHHNLRSHVFL